MNSRKSLYDVRSFYSKKAVLKASFQGMRYQVEQTGQDEDRQLKATIWPEPFCYEKTEPEKRQEEFFPYSEEGLDAVYQWLCDGYERRKPEWDHARDFPLEGMGKKPKI